VSKLLLDKERPLRQSQENPKVQEDTKVPTVARARTLTVLSRLDGDRKARMVRFLNEARLIDPDDVVLALHKADLKGINLSQTELFGAAMIGADLRKADLREAVFYSCDFSKADLSGADLSGAKLWGKTKVTAQYDEGEVIERTRPKLVGASLRGADLSGADLSGADLSGASLSSVNLTHANVTEKRILLCSSSRSTHQRRPIRSPHGI
jgi:uncharacterized protein YjbI with pentapeptide repeats